MELIPNYALNRYRYESDWTGSLYANALLLLLVHNQNEFRLVESEYDST